MSSEDQEIEGVLDDLRARGSRFALDHVVPDELRGWLLNISWDSTSCGPLTFRAEK